MKLAVRVRAEQDVTQLRHHLKQPTIDRQEVNITTRHRWKWVSGSPGQLCDGSHWSLVTKDNPFPYLFHIRDVFMGVGVAVAPPPVSLEVKIIVVIFNVKKVC